MSKEAKEIKITDKRMFTPDGELREEYRFLDQESTAAAPPEESGGRAEAGPGPAAGTGADRGGSLDGSEPDDLGDGPDELDDLAELAGHEARDDRGGARLELPTSADGPAPSFYDLAAMLAEPVAIYLGDVELPDGQSAENLEMARLYIDLLDVLRRKTAGNLTAEESDFLEDLLYRMRVRYVQKRG